jgi:large subunit ribosomal protein L3
MSLKMGLIGRKLGMTQVFHEDGSASGCTVLELGPCVVTAQRTLAKDGYTAVQLGFDKKLVRKVRRPEAGQWKKINLEHAPRYVKEVRLDPDALAGYEVGKVLSANDVFKIGDVVDVVGVTKGKGFQGVMKLHRMSGFKRSHGVHEYYRHGGSIGCRLTPGRVFKGKRMPRHMGNARCTESDLIIVKLIEDKNLVLVRGGVPGPAGGIVLLRGSIKDVKKYILQQVQKETTSKNPMKASKKAAGA